MSTSVSRNQKINDFALLTPKEMDSADHKAIASGTPAVSALTVSATKKIYAITHFSRGTHVMAVSRHLLLLTRGLRFRLEKLAVMLNWLHCFVQV